MTNDRIELLKYGIIAVLFIAGWFALVSASHNIGVQVLLGWVGFGAVVLYYRWVKRNKLRPPNG